jgi:hypothetical protein
VKLKIAALDVPALVTLALVPAAPVVVVPAAIVAAVPVSPLSPFAPVAPVAPVEPVAPCIPCGMPKLSIAAVDVPLLLTVADEPLANVVVLPTETNAVF